MKSAQAYFGKESDITTEEALALLEHLDVSPEVAFCEGVAEAGRGILCFGLEDCTDRIAFPDEDPAQGGDQ